MATESVPEDQLRALLERLANRDRVRSEATVQADVRDLWVPRTSSTSRDQAVFADHATDASLPPDAGLIKFYRIG